MVPSFSIQSLAGACARHPWRVIATWAAIIAVAVGMTAAGLSGVLTNDMVLTTDFESVVGSRHLANSSLADAAADSETVLIQSHDGTTVDDPAFRERTQQVVDEIRRVQGEWAGQGPLPPTNLMDLANGNVTGASVINYYEIQDALKDPLSSAMAERMNAGEQLEALVSEDKTTLLIPVTFSPDDEIQIRQYTDAVNQFDDDRFDATSVGVLSINDEFSEVVDRDLLKAESIGIPIAVLVLVLVFGSLIAPILPLILGVASVALALGMTTVIGQFTDLQLFIQNMISMLGLAVGIDYSLFVVERYREQRDLGYNRIRAIEIAGGTSGKAVMFSGLTVILAMVGVMFVRLNIFFALGLGAIIVVAMAVALTATLLPALLGLLGDRIDWPRHRKPHVESIDERTMYSGFWGGITRVVHDRPWISLIAVVIAMLLLMLPVLDLKTGFTGSSQMPAGQVGEAYKVLEKDFSAGLMMPVEFVFVGDHTEQADAAIADYLAGVNDSGAFATVSEAPRWDEENGIALAEGTLNFAGSSQQAYDVVDTLRNDVAPATIGTVDGLDVYISGQTASEVDMLHHLNGSTLAVFAFVLAMSFVLLMLAFRSVVVPLQAIIYNLLSVGAAWGIMVGVFSNGWFRETLGYTASPIIESWLPILLFCVLFGLSMDYHVFILSRIREHYDVSHDNQESVAIGLKTTGKIITGAAMIMVVVFGAFSKGSMLALQQLGFGLAVAVLLDATLVRSVLVPSVMTIMGDRNWYLPRWLHWLPDLRIEGEPPTPATGADAERPMEAPPVPTPAP